MTKKNTLLFNMNIAFLEVSWSSDFSLSRNTLIFFFVASLSFRSSEYPNEVVVGNLTEIKLYLEITYNLVR